MGVRQAMLTAAVGLSLASAPVLAQPYPQPGSSDQTASSLRDDDDDHRGFPFLIIFAVIAAGLGIYFAVNGDDEDDQPVSA